MLLVNLLVVNRKCFSLIDLLQSLHCMVITMPLSANKHGLDGWMDKSGATMKASADNAIVPEDRS